MPAEDLKKCFGCDERTEFDRLRYPKFADLREDQEEAENYTGKLKYLASSDLRGETAVWSHSVYRIRGR